ncbi:MAG: response regulator, partial [Vicinamibacterales bacterium]
MRTDRPILVVEDDEDSRTMVALLLEIEGYSSVVASDGAEGLALARERHPCLILLDLMMPRMDGRSFCR